MGIKDLKMIVIKHRKKVVHTHNALHTLYWTHSAVYAHSLLYGCLAVSLGCVTVLIALCEHCEMGE